MDNILQNRIKDLILKIELNESINWTLVNNYVMSISQNGPQCGIVALCMALKHLKIDCSVENLMKLARELNFTKSGEIFNINFLSELANKSYKDGCIIHNLTSDDHEMELLKHLLNKKLILIAYDCDSNFEPCFKRGLKAHWALITGLILPIESNSIELFTQTDKLIETNLFDLTNKSISENEINKIIDFYRHNELIDGKINFRESIYVLCRHGKSKHYGVWSLKKLIESNKQLKEIDHVKCNDNDYIKPDDGDLGKTLSSKFIVF